MTKSYKNKYRFLYFLASGSKINSSIIVHNAITSNTICILFKHIYMPNIISHNILLILYLNIKLIVHNIPHTINMIPNVTFSCTSPFTNAIIVNINTGSISNNIDVILQNLYLFL